MVRVPSLKRMGSVATSSSVAYVDVTSIGGSLFGGVLTKAIRSDKAILEIYPNLEELLNYYPLLDEEGSILGVALEGKTLYYQPMADDTIFLVFYTNPPLLTTDRSIPDWIPDHLHRKLLVHGTAYIIYDQIEDGVEGEKVNTASHFYHSFNEDSKNSGIVKMREYLGQRRIHHISSVWRV
jgi:hypothetical protein